MPGLREALVPLTKAQRNYVLFLVMTGDEEASRRLIDIHPATWWEWGKQDRFQKAVGLAYTGSKIEALELYLGAFLPKVLLDLIYMAERDWDKLKPGEQRTKRWAMETIFSLLHLSTPSPSVKQQFNFIDVVSRMKEEREKVGLVIEAESRVLEEGGDATE